MVDKCKGKTGEAKKKCKKKEKEKKNKKNKVPKNKVPPQKVVIPVRGPPKKVPIKGDKGPQNNNSNFKPVKTTKEKVTVVGDACVGVNAFLRAVDAQVGSRMTSDIPCSAFKSILKAAETKFISGKNRMLVKMVSGKLATKMSCQGDIVANVAQLRRNIAEIACVKANGKTVIKVVPAKLDAPPLPQGFVIPRLWDPAWNPEWAKTKGWIRHPYYDWLMPVKEIPTDSTDASISVPPAVDEDSRVPLVEDSRVPVVEDSRVPVVEDSRVPVVEDSRVPGVEPVPSILPTEPVSDPVVRPDDLEDADELEDAVADILDETDQLQDAVADILEETPEETLEETPEETLEETPDPKKKKMSKYLVWGLVGLAVLCIMGAVWWYLKNRGSKQESESLNTGDIDQAFDNSAPPSNDMSYNNDMPGTTELMNDLGPTPSPRTSSR